MINNLRKLIAILFLLAIVPISSYALDASTFFQTSMGDYQEELEISSEEKKEAIMVFFEMDECPFCHWMKMNVLNKPEVQKYFAKHFSAYRIDIEGDVEITDFQGKVTTEKEFASKKHRVRATPVIAFFDLNGKRIVKYTGRTSSVKEFLLLGEFVVSKAYKKMRFSKYKRLKL